MALDYALRPVLQAMGARHVVQGYLVVDAFIESDRDGVATISGEALPGSPRSSRSSPVAALAV